MSIQEITHGDRILILEKDVQNLRDDVNDLKQITKDLRTLQIEIRASLNALKWFVGFGISLAALLAKFF